MRSWTAQAGNPIPRYSLLIPFKTVTRFCGCPVQYGMPTKFAPRAQHRSLFPALDFPAPVSPAHLATRPVLPHRHGAKAHTAVHATQVLDGVHEKAALRRQLRQIRQQISPDYRRVAEQRLCQRLCRLACFRPEWKIGIYFAAGSECSLAPLLALAASRQLTLYAPCIPARGRVMCFARLGAAGGRWRKNRFRIWEYHSPKRLPAARLDVLLLPLLGFDAQGGRLGQGGGYYDATLAFRRKSRHGHRPRLIGVGFEAQRVVAVPTEVHDIRLDAVCTERGVYRSRRFRADPTGC